MKNLPLYQELHYLLSFKGSLLQAIRESFIIARFNALVERPDYKFCHEPLNLSGLEEGQLQLDTSHYQTAYKNDIL